MYIFKENIDIKTFDEFTYFHKYGTFFQNSKWPKIKKEWKPIYTGVFLNDKLVATALVLKRPLLLGYSFLYAPRAIVMDYSNTELLEFYLEQLKTLAKKHKAINLTIDPYFPRASYNMNDKESSLELEYNDSLINLLLQHGFKHKGFTIEFSESIQPRFQPVINIDNDNFKNSRGYKIANRALEGNINIRRGHLEEVENFNNLIQKTADYKNISLRTSNYFNLLLEAYKDDTLITIATLDLVAEEKSLIDRKSDLMQRLSNPTIKAGRRREYESQVDALDRDLNLIEETLKTKKEVDLAGLLIIKNGSKSELLYAGIDRQFLKYNGSNVNYLDAINYSQENNINKLYLGGASGTFVGGVDKFKKTFNPEIEELIGEFIYDNKKLLNNLFNLALNLRSKINRLR